MPQNPNPILLSSIEIDNSQVPTHNPHTRKKIQPSPPMATVSAVLLLFLFFHFTFHPQITALSATLPYLSPTTLFHNYNKMLTNFKIYIYTPQTPISFTQPPLSLFHNYLLNSQFITSDPEEAQLYYIPFSADLSSRSIGRLIKHIRGSQPYWNRTLGADHFFISPAGIESSSDRNIVELKKNSIQVSIFPTASGGNFIPHKDVALPPVNQSPVIALSQANQTTASIFCYMKWDGKTERKFVEQLAGDDDFVIDSEHELVDHVGLAENSKFCLFLYKGEVEWLVEAMAFGCVPVMLVESPIQDMPLMDVLRWSEMALVVGINGGVGQLKTVLNEVQEVRYRKMKKSAMAASRHLVWNDEPQPHDAFYMVVYQLWLRRHAIRYALRQ